MKVQDEIKQLKDPKKAVILQRFFKTGPGEYGEGDIFLGLTIPQSRSIAKKYSDLSLLELKKLLRSKIHEERVVALLILSLQYRKGSSGPISAPACGTLSLQSGSFGSFI